jgi:hypothetical protein
VDHLSGASAKRLQQVAGVIAPGFGDLDPGERERFCAIVDAALSERPSSVARQLGVLLGVIELAAVLRWGRRFERLGPARAASVLQWFQEAPVDRLRRGFWGLKTLVYMGYYGRPAASEEIGYRPEADGRGALDG